MKRTPLTIRRCASGWALMCGSEVIDIYADQATAQAARDYATYIGWALAHPKAAGR